MAGGIRQPDEQAWARAAEAALRAALGDGGLRRAREGAELPLADALARSPQAMARTAR